LILERFALSSPRRISASLSLSAESVWVCNEVAPAEGLLGFSSKV